MRDISRRSLLASTGLALGGSALLGSGVDLARALQPDGEMTWPQGQHDARNTGAAPDIDAPTGEYLQQRWGYQGDDLGFWHQPAVVDGTIYATEDVTFPGTSGRVVAIDGTDGSVQWDTSGHEQLDSTLPVSPVVAAGVVCVPTESGMIGLDADTGEIEWAKESVRPSGDRRTSDSSPVLVDSTVFVPARDERVVALDITDGSTERVYPTEQQVSSVAVTDALVAVGGTEGVVVSERGSGETAWTFDTPSTVEHVVVADEHVFAVGENETMHALGLASGDRQWTAPVQSHTNEELPTIQPSPSVAEGRLVVSTPTDALEGSYWQDSALVARDTSTGDVLWTSELLDGRATIAGEYVYVSKDANGLVVGDLDDGTLVSHFVSPSHQLGRFPGRTDSTDPVVVDGTIYLPVYSRDSLISKIIAVEPSDDVPQGSIQDRKIAFLSDRGGEPYTVGEEITLGEKRREAMPFYTTNYGLQRGLLRVDFDGDGEFEWSKLVPEGGLPDGEAPSWTYDEPGEYEVAAKFVDEYGRSTTVTKTITIISRSELPDMGEARIEVTDDGLCAREFTGSVTGEGSGDLSYYWEFGDEPVPEFDPDNESKDGKQTSFGTTEHGTYYARLVVRDDEHQTVTTMREFDL